MKDYQALIKGQNELIKKLDVEAKAIAKTLHENREKRRKAIAERQALATEKKAQGDAARIAKAEKVAQKKEERAKKAQEAALKFQESVKAEKAKIADLKSSSGKTVAKKAASKKGRPIQASPAVDLDPLALEAELKSL